MFDLRYNTTKNDRGSWLVMVVFIQRIYASIANAVHNIDSKENFS